MSRETDRITLRSLLRAGLRRSMWRSAAGVLVALVATGALFGAATGLIGMGRLLTANLEQLGADLVVAPRGSDAIVEGWLRSGEAAAPLPETVPVAEWREKLKAGKVVGIEGVDGWSLADGGRGRPAGPEASVLLIRLESWASPLIAVQEVQVAIPGAAVVTAEQATRQVTRHLQPIVRYMSVAAGVALLAAVLMTGLLASVRVAERRGELGMMRAMGATRSFLIRLTLAESAILAVGGSAAGLALGLSVVPFLPGGALERLSWGEISLLALGSVLITILVTLGAALVPAARAAVMDPLDAIRRGR